MDKSGLLKYYQKEGVLGKVSSGELFNRETSNNEAASLVEAQATFLALKEEAKNEGILGLGKTEVLSAREIAKQSIELSPPKNLQVELILQVTILKILMIVRYPYALIRHFHLNAFINAKRP